ncbi:hypothetical protein Tco_1270752, partial [Tanacetum coccineum]
MDTPQQNSVVERKHRHLVKTARSILVFVDVPSILEPTPHASDKPTETTTTIETPGIDTPPETTTTTETPQFTVSKATPTITQSSADVKVVVGPPPSGRLKHNCKSTKRDDFVYSCYSSMLSLFIASIHRLYEPMSYREAVCDPL